MAANQNEQIDRFVRGICKYTSHAFEKGNVPGFYAAEYNPSASLRILLDRCVAHQKANAEYLSYTSHLYEADRIDVLQTHFKESLKKAADSMAHLEFLTKCAMDIIAGSYLKQNGFPEALDIIRVAIYEAIVDSKQRHYLKPWFYVQEP